VQFQASFVNSLRPCPAKYREEVFNWLEEQAKTWGKIPLEKDDPSSSNLTNTFNGFQFVFSK
jgi:16S rRNA G966 N2-methylase RsmD